MRIDARNLLDRLGRSDFSYKEFEDRFTDLELWPILEALLRDPRLQALDPALPGKSASSPAVERSDAAIGTAPEAAPPVAQPLKTLFSRYEQVAETTPAEAQPIPAAHDQNVRGLLRRLSGSDEPRGAQGDN